MLLDAHAARARRLALAVAFVAPLAVAGCLGENRKVREEQPRPSPTPAEARSEVPWVVYREIGNPPSYDNTTRLVVAKDGICSLDHGTARVQEPITPDEQKDLTALAQRVGWDKLPTEYLARTNAKPVANAHTYEITWYGGTSPRTVTTHDGVDNEDEALQTLRAKLRDVAKRVEGLR